MLKLAFSAALLSSAVLGVQTSSIEKFDVDTLVTESSLYEFAPIDYQLVKGVSNKKSYTYTFSPGTTLTGSYNFDFAAKYQWSIKSDQKDISAKAGYEKSQTIYYNFVPQLSMNMNGYWKNTFISPYFAVSGTWLVIPFNFKPLVYEVKIPVNEQKNGVC